MKIQVLGEFSLTASMGWFRFTIYSAGR